MTRQFIAHQADTSPQTTLGGKAANLQKLTQAGLPVPPWTVIGTEVFDSIFAPHREQIKNIISQIDFKQQQSIAIASAQIGELIGRQCLPDNVEADLQAWVEHLAGLGETSFAVRSSAQQEDSASASFAGQLDTLLFVSRRDIATSIQRIWRSAFSERILSYTFSKGIDPLQIRVAVIVQVMINSKAAGVFFTRSPNKNVPHAVCIGGYGLGEGVVSGKTDTDTWQIDFEGKIVQSQISDKKSKLIKSDATGESTRSIAVETSLADKPVLNNEHLAELTGLCNDIRKLYSCELDIEWVMDEQHQLWITQARPITTLRAAHVFDCSNIVEGYPGVTLPLTFSFIRGLYQAAFTSTFRSIGVSAQRLVDHVG